MEVVSVHPLLWRGASETHCVGCGGWETCGRNLALLEHPLGRVSHRAVGTAGSSHPGWCSGSISAEGLKSAPKRRDFNLLYFSSLQEPEDPTKIPG